MSIHPSLGASSRIRKQRSVLKRIEKIKHLMDKGLFNEQSSVLGLPKIKYIKIKIKKEKAEEKPSPTAAADVGAPPATASAKAEKSAPKK
jgi:small basic protein (TIGR04137 family)